MSNPNTSSAVFSSEASHREWLASQSALPGGFRVGTASLTFTPVEVSKSVQMNLTLLVLDEPTEDFAAVFTSNAFPGAPVRIGRSRLGGRLGAILVNNKISNVCAPEGVAVSERLCAETGALLGMRSEEVLPSSTGVIGWQLPVERMIETLPAAVSSLQSVSVLPASEAIMTTDLYPKVRRADVGGGSIVGIAKGAGMIEPNLATMLVYILTDLAVPREALREMLPLAVAESFNAISIDSDQSTSDTVVLLSSGRVPVEHEAFFVALRDVCARLAEDVVRNGEGVKHVMRVSVSGAPSVAVAKGVAKSVVNSPLWQCAVCGNDPNVGRLVCAAGKYLGTEHPEIDVDHCTMRLGGCTVFSDGAFHLDLGLEEPLCAHLKAAEMYKSAPPDRNGIFTPPVCWPAHERRVEIEIDLGVGAACFAALGGDRTHEYISENADYRS